MISVKSSSISVETSGGGARIRLASAARNFDLNILGHPGCSSKL